MPYVFGAPEERTEWSIHGDKFLQGAFRFIAEQLTGRKVVTATARDDANYEYLVSCRGLQDDGKAVQDGTSLFCEEEPGYNPRNPSRSGFEIDIDEMKPPVVALMLGTYPTKYKDELPPNFAKYVRGAVTKARKYGAQVILIGPFANDANGKRLAVLRSFVPDTINGYTLVEGLPRARASFLLTQDGYRELSTRLIAAVSDTLSKRQRVPSPPRPSAQPGAGGQPLQPPIQPQPQAPMAARQPVAAPTPAWVWGLVGVAGVSVVILTIVLLKKRRTGLAEYEEQDPLHERIAKVLGWSVKDTQSFSLQALRELVRPVSPKLVHEIDRAIGSGEVIKGRRYCLPRRYDY